MRKIVCLLAALAAMPSAAWAALTEYVELDGEFYNVPVSSGMLTVDGSYGSWIMPTASMLNCARRNGGVSNYTTVNLMYDPNYDVMFLSSGTLTCTGSPTPTMCVITLVSSSGDMHCNGSLSAPPDRIYANGFN